MANLTQHEISTADEGIQSDESAAAALAELESKAQDEAPKETEIPEDRPEWLPEKFKTPEDLANSYKELEARMSAGETKEEAESTPLEITRDEAVEAAEKAGIDFDAMTAKYAENGELSEDDYKSIEEAGIKREVVDGYIAGQRALADQITDKMFETVGGKESFQQLSEWASQSLNDDELDLYNEAVTSGDLAKTKFAVEGLHARFVAANGSEPSRQLSGSTPKGVEKFASEAEHIKAIEDPRYWNDQAYRESVERKFLATWG